MNANQKKFVRWMAKNHPEVARRAKEMLERDALMAEVGGFVDAFTDAIEKVAPALLNVKAQRDLLKVQVERARQGLEPLEASQISPTVKVAVEPSFTVPTWLKWTGGGLLVAAGARWAMNRKKK